MFPACERAKIVMEGAAPIIGISLVYELADSGFVSCASYRFANTVFVSPSTHTSTVRRLPLPVSGLDE